MHLIWLAAALAAGPVALAATEIAIVVPAAASPAEQLAGNELAGYLRRLYPQDRFAVTTRAPDAGKRIKLLADGPRDERYEVTAAGDEVVIRGGGPRAVLYGVYALLQQLGCRFHLSGDVLPAARTEPLSFTDWNLTDRPLVRDRIVFNWHNFLSGCSTWNLPDWKRWTAQSQKLGYNAIMVHAYGNNPMAAFTFEGTTKPVGYLSTTAKGRDWSTVHVNDVRRLFGGAVFDGPVFGAAAGMVPDGQRIAAAQALMRDVFADAAQRDMGVVFAVDVDTPSANPPELVRLLPESARFKVDELWLPNPDTLAGEAYYRAQVAGLLKVYPQITTLVVWFRRGGTPWMNLKLNDLPAAWQQEFATEIARTPGAEQHWHAPGLFAIGKIVRAFDRALNDCDAEQTRLAAGTWGFEFLRGADRFFPAGVPLIGLDYDVINERSQLGTAAAREVLHEIGAHRPVIPVIWAHHDDRHYIGRPYTPFAEFHTKLADAKAGGFGIIHWTTRPLDQFFASHARQVWQRTKDEPLRATCDQVGGRALGEYLHRWITEAPQFARETSDYFIDRPLTDIPQVVAGCRERLALLGAADDDQANYYTGLEQFIIAFHETHDLFQRSQAVLKSNDVALARQLMAQCRPEPVIEQFAQFSSIGGITRGEQGLVVSLNLRWLTHIIRHRQALGLEPVRIRFGATQHDKLAQSRGKFTFHFDADQKVWEVWGEEETGATTFTSPTAAEEIARTGIESDKPLNFALRPIMAVDSRNKSRPALLPAGAYRLRLFTADPVSTKPGQRVFEVRIGGTDTARRYTFAPVKAKFLRLVCHGNSVNDWNSINDVTIPTYAGAVTASAAVKGYSAADAVDGKADTRWAQAGDGAWIQFTLADDRPTSHIEIAWFEGDRREYKFDLLVSTDGHDWVKTPYHTVQSTATSDRVDVFQRAGGTGRLVELVYPVSIDARGVVEVTLVPITGKLVVCGAILETKGE